MTRRIGGLVVAVAVLTACSSEGSPTKVDPEVEAAKRKRTAEALAEANSGPKTKAEPDDGVGEGPLHSGVDSLATLGKDLVAALDKKDEKGLWLLATTELEFRERLYGALYNGTKLAKTDPRPVWKAQHEKSAAAVTKALAEHGGKGYEFVSLESTTKEDRGSLVIHRSPTLKVKDADGKPLELTLIESVIEHPGSKTFEILAFGS